jgi:hypothetical protein
VSAARCVPGAALAAALLGCSGRPVPEPAPGPKAKQLVVSPGLVVERACTPSGPELCFNARDDNCNGIIDEGCGVHTGLVQFVIAWDEPQADVDLLVTDPNGELIEVGASAESGLVKDRDCPGQSNACYGQNLENVYLEEGDPLRGNYQVRVRLEKLGGENPPIHVTLGARVGPKTYAAQFELGEPAQERSLRLQL